MGAEIQVIRYGDLGPPLLYVPTSGGDHTEFERYGLPEDCAPWIGAGRVQIFSVDGFGPKGLFDDSMPPPLRIERYAAFERCAVLEVLPWILSLARNPEVGVVGASYGAFVAASLFLKTAGAVRVACGLGGVYSMEHRLPGHASSEAARSMPLRYLSSLDDQGSLAALRATLGFHIFAARNDPWLPSSHDLDRALAGKGIPRTLDVWPAPADHHEVWWKRQIRVFLDRCYGLIH